MPEPQDLLRRGAAVGGEPDLAVVERRVRGRRRRRRSVVVGTAALVVALLGAGVLVRQGDSESQRVVTGPDGRSLSEPVGSWRQAADPPFEPREGAFTATTDDGRILVWGGGGQGGPDGIHLDGGIYDPETDEWETIEPAPLEPSGFFTRARLAGGRLAVAGVSNGGAASQESMAVYDLAERAWTVSPPSDIGAGETMAWDGETLVLLSLGGLYDPDATDEPVTLRWRFGDDAWTTGAPYPLGPRAVAAVASSPEAIAVWGGTTTDLSGDVPFAGEDAGATADGAVYDAADDTWAEMAPGPLAPRVHPSAIWRGDEVVIGGGATGFDGTTPPPDATVAAYDVAASTWRELPDPPVDQLVDDRLVRSSDGAPEFLLELTDSDAITIEGMAGYSGPQARWFTLGGEWEEAPFYDLHDLDVGLVATSATRDNPDDGPFQLAIRVAPGVWLDGADGPFTNRMEPAVGTAGDHLLVVGGLEGRDIELVGDAWVFDVSG